MGNRIIIHNGPMISIECEYVNRLDTEKGVFIFYSLTSSTFCYAILSHSWPYVQVGQSQFTWNTFRPLFFMLTKLILKWYKNQVQFEWYYPAKPSNKFLWRPLDGTFLSLVAFIGFDDNNKKKTKNMKKNII